MIVSLFPFRFVLASALAAATLPFHATAQEAPKRMPAPIVYFDIAGPADAGQTAFYEKVFGWIAGPGGVVAVPVSGPVLPGTLRTDPAQKVIYIGVPDVAATLTEIEANGGKTVAPRFEVPGVVVLGLFTDPAGNAMGLVELTADGQTKIP
jgi:predicted enzyme related to lactoylglutathione lyase